MWTMLDSGAFSAWRRGVAISLVDYMAYAREHAASYGAVVCLDEIPAGKLGSRDGERAAAASYRNQQVMKDAGLSPIPVFHQGENFDWLDRYLLDGEPYIGLSPYARASRPDLISWLDDCFTRLTDAAGRPLVKTHGFGATGEEVVRRYPWASADSATWGLAAAYGKIKVPHMGARPGMFDYDRPARVICTTTMRQSVTADSRHISRISPAELAHVRAFLVQCGLTLADVGESFDSRRVAQVHYYMRALRAPRRFAHKRRVFFTQQALGEAVAHDFRLVFATEPYDKRRNGILDAANVRNRLVSYFNLRSRS